VQLTTAGLWRPEGKRMSVVLLSRGSGSHHLSRSLSSSSTVSGSAVGAKVWRAFQAGLLAAVQNRSLRRRESRVSPLLAFMFCHGSSGCLDCNFSE